MHGVVLVVPRIIRGLSGGGICGVKPRREGCSCCKMKAHGHLRMFVSASFAEGQSHYAKAEMAV